MEEVHVLFDCDASFGCCILDGFLLNLESEFGLPEFAFFWIIKQEILSSALVAVYRMNNFPGGGVFCDLLQVVTTAATV